MLYPRWTYLIFAMSLLIGVAGAGVAAAQTWETLHDFDSVVDIVFVAGDGGIGAAASSDYYHSPTGTTWDLGRESVFMQDVAGSGGKWYAASLDGLLVSADDGRTWDVLMPSDTWSVYAEGDQIAAGGGGGQLYVSEDAGTTWRVTTCETMPQGFDSYVAPVMIRDGVQMWGHSQAGTHSSVFGAPWIYEENFAPSFFVRLPGGTTLADDGSSLLEYTADGAWVVYSHLPTSFADKLHAKGDNMVLVGTRLHVTANAGGSWTEIELPADEFPYDAAIDGDGRVVVGTSCCVRRTIEPIADLVATSKRSEIADVRTELRPPNPNPAPNGTAIRFVLERPVNIRIDVVDVVGQTLDTLIDTILPTGPHNLWWETGHVASGTYFVRMRAGKQAFTRPVVVVR